MEIWKDIDGYEDLYQISNLGNVKSLSRIMWNGNSFWKSKEKILKPNLTTSGYYSVQFMKHNIRKPFSIHRLVAKAFLTEIKGFEVNHIDRNKLNNKLDNLEFISHSDNVKHSYLTGRKKKANHFQNGRSNFIIDYFTGIYYTKSEFYFVHNITRKKLNKFLSNKSRYSFM